MSNIDANTRKAQQTELAEMQLSQKEKKQRLQQSQETEISSIQDNYKNKKAALIEQNEASINHIRKSQGDNSEYVQAERARLYDRHKNQMDQLEKNYRSNVEETQEKRQVQLDTTRATTHQKLQQIDQNSQKQIEKVRERSQVEIQQSKEHHNKEIEHIKDYSERQQIIARTNNEKTLQTQIDTGRVAQEKLIAGQQRDFDKTRDRGDMRIDQERSLTESKLARVDQEYQKNYDKNQNQWVNKEEHLNKEYSNKLDETKQRQEKQLTSQSKHHARNFELNENRNRQELENQNERYDTELTNTQRKFVRNVAQYRGKEEDPFYKVEDRGSHMRESPDFYVLKAFVPEHEKDSVRVTVKSDGVQVSGNRAFKDAIDEGDKKSSTSTFQSFKEDFPFEKPVVTEGMTRERDGDWMVYTIPKLASMKYSRKA